MNNEVRHNKSDWGKRIYSYLFGNMPLRERNALEREEQKDPLMADALEGLDTFSRNDYLKDVKSLENRLDVRTKRKILHRWMAVAATIIFIGGISFLLFLLIPKDSGRLAQNREEKQSSFVEPKPVYRDETVEPVVPEEKITLEKSEGRTTENEQQVVRQQKGVVAKSSSKKMVVMQIVEDDIELDEEMEVSDMDEVVIVNEQMAMPVAAKAEKAIPVYDSSRKKEDAIYSIVAIDQDRNAEPELGMGKYKKELVLHIKKSNIVGGRKIKATIELTISANGSIKKIDILRLSEKDFNDELVRIIRNGPAWMPAIRNGSSGEDKVKFKILAEKDDLSKE